MRFSELLRKMRETPEEDTPYFDLDRVTDEEIQKKFKAKFTEQQIKELRRQLTLYTKNANTLDEVIENIDRWHKTLKGILN